jgi:anthranilate/para-aminobenzoate synthase component II
MKYIIGIKETLVYDEEVVNVFPETMNIYTSDGSYTLKKGDVTREVDIIRASYYQNTASDGDITKDGEPDTCVFDIHFVKNSNGFKTIVNITYGDQMKSEFSIESPNKIKVGHYNGIGSKLDSETQFGFEDNTIQDLVKLFNSFNFGYKLTTKDLTFIDKYPDTYVNEDIKLTPLFKNEIILVINNTKPSKNLYLNNLLNYLKSRGIEFEIASSEKDIHEISSKFKVIGAISTGSEYRIADSTYETKVSNYAYENLKCPILGICYGLQSMSLSYGGSIKDSGEFIHKHLKPTQVNKDHFLFKDVNIDNIEFSFSFHDIIDKMPDGFKSIAMLNDVIVAISDSDRDRYGLLFHPEDKEMSYPVLDNFISKCKGGEDEQEKLFQGKFEHLVSFTDFRV